MPSPLCQVKDGAGAYTSTSSGVNVTPSNTITINLVSSAGVSTWSISCITTDELSVAATVNASLTIDSVAKTATFTAPVAGRAYRFQSKINGGVDVNGVVQASYTTTFCIYTLASSGSRVHAVDETYESNPTFGWIGDLNALIRTGAGTVTPSGVRGQVYESGDAGSGIVSRWANRDLPSGTTSSTGAINDKSTLDANSNPLGLLTFTGAGPSLTGLTNGTDGRRFVVGYIGAGTMSIVNDSASSTAANRIVTGTGSDLVLYNNESVSLWYDTTNSRWRVSKTFGEQATITNASTGTLSDVSTINASSIAAGGVIFSGAAPSVTGFSNGTSGRTLRVTTTGGPLVLQNQTTSAAANQIVTGTGGNVTLATGESAVLFYDSTNSFWRLVDESARTQTLTNKTISGASNTISNVAIGSAVSGLGAGVATMLGTFSSANIQAACTDETGSGGSLVFATGPTISAPTISGSPTFSGTPIMSGASSSTTNNAKGTTVDKNPVNLQTTNATPTNLDTATIGSGSAVTYSWLVTAIQSTSAAAASFSVTAVWRNNAGTVAQVGTTTVTVNGRDSALSAATVTCTNSTTTIQLVATGIAATTIQWTAIMTALTVIP